MSKATRFHPWEIYEAVEPSEVHLEDDASIYMREGKSRSPEINFVRHFFLSSISDLFCEDEQIRRDAWRWLMSEDQGYIFSYMPTCSILNLDPIAVRERIIKNNKNFEAGAIRELRNAS